MKKNKSYKVKDSKLKNGKLVDNSRLVDNKKFQRSKDETDPQRKWKTGESKPKNPDSVQEFVDMLETKKNEDIGVY